MSSASERVGTGPARAPSKWPWCGLLLLAVACGPVEQPEPGGQKLPAAPEVNEDPTLLRPTVAGVYRVSLRPAKTEVQVGPLHSWILHLETLDGLPVHPTRIAVDGGMPQHGHGFVTEPRVTGTLGDGDFAVEGVKFHMAGEWSFRFEIVGPEGADVANFLVQVGP